MIQFELTPDDYVSFQKHFIAHHWTFFQKHWRWLFVILFAPYVFSSSDSLIDGLLDWGNWVIVIFASLVIFSLTRLSIFRQASSIKTLIKKNPQSIGARQIDFDDERVTIKTTNSSTEYNYTAFKNLEETSDYYFVFVSEQVAIILPKRISEKQALLTLIEKIKASLVQ